MDMNFGSGEALLGGSSPLQQVFEQYQSQGGGQIAAQTPNSAGFNPSVPQQLQGQPGAPAPTPPMGGQPPVPTPVPTPGQPMPQGTEADLILEALNTRLKHNSKMEEKKLEMGIV